MTTVDYPDLPLLYSFRRCPYAMRARLALQSAGQVCVMREILLRDKPNHMLALSPKGTVPVLWLGDGTVIDESLDVMHWALSQNDPEGWLSFTAETQVLSDKLIEENDGPFKHHLDRYKYANRYEKEDKSDHRQACLETLQELNRQIGNQDWLFGASPRLTDFALLPFIRQCRIADPEWFDSQSQIANVHRWLRAFLESQRFELVMTKYDVWQEGTPVVHFPLKAG